MNVLTKQIALDEEEDDFLDGDYDDQYEEDDYEEFSDFDKDE
jgi:hypothetical protein